MGKTVVPRRSRPSQTKNRARHREAPYVAGLARSAYRIKFEPAFRGNYDGFRVARTYRLEKLWSIRSGTSRFMTDSLALSSSR